MNRSYAELCISVSRSLSRPVRFACLYNGSPFRFGFCTTVALTVSLLVQRFGTVVQEPNLHGLPFVQRLRTVVQRFPLSVSLLVQRFPLSVYFCTTVLNRCTTVHVQELAPRITRDFSVNDRPFSRCLGSNGATKRTRTGWGVGGGCSFAGSQDRSQPLYKCSQPLYKQ
jgi:hypothetical protein